MVMAQQTLPLISLKNVSKAFPGVQALDNVSLEIFPGEVHAVLGENGAGKSTLMKILSGIITKDSGGILLQGEKVEFNNPREAIDAGISLVQQELSLIPSLSIAENIFLGRWPQKGVSIDWDKINREASELLQRFRIEENPQTLVEKLSVAKQQLIEILKAYSRPATKVLLLDEPTSALSEEEVKRLFGLLEEVKKEDKAIIFISHKIGEALQLADRITILRDGKKVITVPRQDISEEDVIFYMTGKRFGGNESQVTEEKIDREIVLSLRNFSSDGYVKDIELDVYQGEILAIFGLMGSGRTALARALFGLCKTEGEILLEGKKVSFSSPVEAIESGIGYIPEDRREGLVYELPVFANITLATFQKMSRRGILNLDWEYTTASKMVEELQIRTPSIFREVLYLSGGNQQKVLLARWLASNPKILIMDEPTRGIDVGAKFEIRSLVKNLARAGITVLFITSEPLEALEMGDRILVMRNGKTVKIINNPQEITKSDLLALASGIKRKEQNNGS
ncbi:MAG TPA: sugar ABC transporter ATP-binding protein [Candidatus Atribacteria bacterium]|nr:sugar ABC transporter ATP-binding protein [Candidatus Atribacteria bacterium]